MVKIYLVSCTEPNFNAGGTRSHVSIYTNKNQAMEKIKEHHGNNCSNGNFVFYDDKLNSIHCDKCEFYFDDNNNIDDNYTRKYCDECKQYEEEVLHPIDCLCKLCTYEKMSDYYSRKICNDCINLCECSECSFDLNVFTQAINENKEIRQKYLYTKNIDGNTYIAIDIFNFCNKYEISWRS
jgi:hypothetical protein